MKKISTEAPICEADHKCIPPTFTRCGHMCTYSKCANDLGKGVAQWSNGQRAEWLGETEHERVRIVREWVQMTSQQRGSRGSRRENKGVVAREQNRERIGKGLGPDQRTMFMVKSKMKTKSSHNCGLRKATIIRSGKTSLLKSREESGSRKAITSSNNGEMALQKTLVGIGKKIQVTIGPRKLQQLLGKLPMEPMKFGMKMGHGKRLKIGQRGLPIHQECCIMRSVSNLFRSVFRESLD
ncbi:hypothetical protein L6452_06278 [Arctium lappa]|uniref:Uncharacterized protein n=1 Tax=Arctium lappa TaxID=4217 RepID=A0ACB9EIN6_ARCLA|nr:hypothetical protein L6452_06278 [Arctium lappa]